MLERDGKSTSPWLVLNDEERLTRGGFMAYQYYGITDEYSLALI